MVRSILTYTQSKYVTLTTLQSTITNIADTIHNEINNIKTDINNIEITNQQYVSKELHYHNNCTDYTFKRNNTIHKYDNRRTFIAQHNYFTYQRKCNQELQIQLLNYSGKFTKPIL